MFNVYRKNLSVVAVARKYDCVKSILDAFSIELTFHKKTSQKIHKSHDVHRDAGEHLTYHFLMYYLSEVILNNM